MTEPSRFLPRKRAGVPNNKVRRNGSYAPLSSRYYKDDAIILAGERAELLYVRGLAFSAGNEPTMPALH